MEPVKLMELCRKEGRVSLNEAESKQLLQHYDVPVVSEVIAKDMAEAETMAQQMGYPVVLKGLGANLTHKTERGLVRVNLKSTTELHKAFREIHTEAGGDWEGCLIQPLVDGRREFVAGMVRDPQFGPAIMFGLGGIFAEALGDVVFRIAPVDHTQALQMLEGLETHKLLENFRGEAAANRDQLLNVLTGLSRLAMAHPEIKEVDINPLIVSPNGEVTAVDALVVLNQSDDFSFNNGTDKDEDRQRTARLNAALDVMTHPKSIAVVGVARTKLGGYPGIFGCIRNFGYPGRLYPINPNADEIDGIKAYPTLLDLPESVDLTILSVPAPKVPDALRDCIASGNKNVHIFTSGFKETGEEEGIRLQADVERIARENGLNIIGPNCMGIHVPSERLLTWVAAPEKSGPVAFISQSGGNSQDFSNYAANYFGVHFSKVISYGNAAVLDSTDLLSYLGQDDETRIIAMYIEGVKDGRKLLRLVTEINRHKPIVIMKGGLSESGARTVASHTGSLAGGEKIWRAFFKQSNAICVDSLAEMAEVVLALNHLPKVRGRGVAILGTGGGIGVAAADSCAKAGVNLPALPPELLQRLREFIPPAGNMIRNPIDAHILLVRLDLLGPVLRLISSHPDLDMFVISLHLDWLFGLEEGKHIERIGNYLADEVQQYTSGKPLAVVLRQYQANPAAEKCRVNLKNRLLDAGIPVYDGLDRAVSVLSKVAGYYMGFEK